MEGGGQGFKKLLETEWEVEGQFKCGGLELRGRWRPKF